MYAVSEAYIASMAAALREMPSFSVLLYNADNEANYSLTLSYDPEPLQRGEDLNAFNKVSARTPRATLEHNWLKADGSYTTSDTGDYIGVCLSSGTPDEGGLYAYDAADTITVSIASGSSQPLSFLLDAAIAAVEITHTDGSAETVSFEQDGAEHILPVQDSGTGKVSLTFLYSFYPYRRPRVYGIYAATVFRWNCDDIVGVELEDENDLVCLELPSRKVKLVINNLDGKLDPYKESVDPTFYRKETQAFLTFLYEGEPVPIGRLFLDTYAVDREEIAFSFEWAIMPLADSKHSLSRVIDYTVPERIMEIIDRDPEMVVRTIQDVEENTAAVYRIKADTKAVVSMTTVIQNPYPICSRAECFQLLCNAAGILMRPARQEDIAFLPTQVVPVRDISYDELLAEPEYSCQEDVAGTTVSFYDLQTETALKLDSVTSFSDKKIRIELEEPATASSGWQQIIYDNTGMELGLVSYAAQGYVAFVWNEMNDSTQQWTQESGEITVYVRKRKKTTVDFGSAPRKKIDNPLIDSSLLSSYWWNISQLLTQNATVTIKHRGFPELDTGDKIRVQLHTDGEYVEARIIQNKWEFESGVLSGSTKLKLATGVG